MRIAALAMVVSMLGASVATAEPAAKKDAPAAATAATCKRKVVGKGLERHSVCVIEAPIVVKASSKPAVVVVPQDPRGLVGRPKSSDRLDGLSHQLRP